MAEKKDGSFDGMTGLLAAVVSAAVLYGLWYFFKEEVKFVFKWVRYAEMKVIAPFVPRDHAIESPNFDRPFNFHDTLEVLPNVNPAELSLEQMQVISQLALPFYYPFFALGLILFGLWAVFFGPHTHYRKVFTLNTLIDAQSRNFPIISFLRKFNPAEVPPRAPGAPVPAELPAFAEALGPEEWIAYNVIPLPDGEFDREAARKAFARQLGRRWRGAKQLPPHLQCLLAGFALKSVRKREESDELLDWLAESWHPEKGLNLPSKLLRRAQNVLRDPKIGAPLLKVCNRHAYEVTAMLGALDYTRSEGGVLAPPTFLWLRAYDRNFWYPLNNLGRQTFHMEGLGAHCHYKLEKLTGRPVPKPHVDKAVNELGEYMADVKKRRPIPPLDYTAVSGKTRGIMKPV